MAKTALIAGGGALPQLVAKAQHNDIFVAALKGFTDPDWIEDYPHAWLKLGQVGKLLKLLKKQNITQIVFAGHLRRPSFGQFYRHYGIDVDGIKLLWQLRDKKMGDDALLRRVAEFFNAKGFAIVGADQLVPDSLMPLGALTSAAPEDDATRDIDYAVNILQSWAALDQGQAIVVQQGMILGVEAAEGTDELIKRCGAYKREGVGPILVKIKKPQQDRRLDLPTIGEQTLRKAAQAGFSGIAVQANETLFINPAGCVSIANENGLFLLGFKLPSAS